MTVEKEFAPYQESFELKELGFDELCIAYYDQWVNTNNEVKQMFRIGEVKGVFDSITPAPTYSQAFRFFRKKHGLYHIIHCPTKDVAIFTITGFDIPSVHSDVELKSYEEAELACLRKLIQIAKEGVL